MVGGVLAGIYLLITIGWIRGVQVGALASSVTPGTGTPAEVAVYAVHLVERGAAIAAAPLWFAAVLWRIGGARRIAWLLLGAVLLVPWPVLVHA